jgi:acyl dehydratase
MSSRPVFAALEVGQELPAHTFIVTRETLIRYAGASGDFNVIHWSQRHALEVGLPDVIAHGNLTMALGARYLTQWAGDPGALSEYGVRFTKPVVVPDTDVGTTVEITGKILELDGDSRVRIDLTVTSEGQKVLAQARAWVHLS